MQLYAQDQKGTRVFVEVAEKAKIYFCLECKNEVRLRGGPHVQLHFYHAEKNGACRQNGKGNQHLLLQKILQKAYPGSIQEYPFDSIARIGDVVLPEKKILFEVQCSSMSAREAKARIEDYRSVGFEIIWILSDSTFNKRKVSAFEMQLVDFPHYYAKEDQIYDSCDVSARGVRTGQGIKRRVEVSGLMKRQAGFSEVGGERLIRSARQRVEHWQYHLKGDLLEAIDNGEEFAELQEKEVEVEKKTRRMWIRDYLKALYHSLLSMSCKR